MVGIKSQGGLVKYQTSSLETITDNVYNGNGPLSQGGSAPVELPYKKGLCVNTMHICLNVVLFAPKIPLVESNFDLLEVQTEYDQSVF